MQPDFELPGQQEFVLSDSFPVGYQGPRMRGGGVIAATREENSIVLQVLNQSGFKMTLNIFEFLNTREIQGYQETAFLVSFVALKNNIRYFIEGLGSLYLKAGHFAMFRSGGHPIAASIEHGKEIRTFGVSWSEEFVQQAAPFFPFLKQFIEETDTQRSFFLGQSVTKAGSRILGLIHDLINNPYDEPVSQLFYENKIRELLLEMLVEKGRKHIKRPKTTKEDKDKIMAIGELISTEINKKFPISSLAQKAGMSEMKLKIIFKEFFGKAIFEYQLAARMEEAHRLLLESSLTTKAIAAKVGYKNTTSFISKFKDHFGYPPGTIQK